MPETITPQAVASLAASLGRGLSEAQARGLAVYLTLLARWNAATNLVGKRDVKLVMTDLIADSWHLADFLAPLDLGSPDPVSFDLGAGAGLPGIPLRLFWSAGRYYLVEPRAKRAAFLEAVLAELDLPETFVIEARAEDILPRKLSRGDKADLCLSRAFMPWREYAVLARGLVREGGLIAVMANDGPPGADEIPAGLAPGPGTAYQASGKTRYVWSLTPVSEARKEF